MPDNLSPEARSAHMRRIRNVDTGPEMRVRRVTHALGYRFRLHRRDLPGTPDLIFPRLRKVIFVHGCFWHRHSGCRHARLPKSRRNYWLPKLKRNSTRDTEVVAALRALGWTVLVVWECQVATEKDTSKLLLPFLSGLGN